MSVLTFQKTIQKILRVDHSKNHSKFLYNPLPDFGKGNTHQLKFVTQGKINLQAIHGPNEHYDIITTSVAISSYIVKILYSVIFCHLL